MLRRRLFACFLAGSLSVPAACSAQAQNSAPDVAAIKRLRSVSISPVVGAPEHLVLFGQSQSLGGLAFGALGAAAAQSGAEPIVKKLELGLATRKQDIKTIAREVLAEQVRATGVPAKLVSGAADAQFQIKIEFYGLAGKNRLSSELVPTLRIRATLIGQSGSVLWEKRLHSDVDDPSHTPKPVEAFTSDPGQLVRAYRNASRLIFSQMLSQLKSL